MFLVLHGIRCLIVTDLFLDSTRYNVLCRVSAVHSSIVNVINLCLCHSVCSWVIVFVHSLKSVPLICILSLCPTTTSHQTFPSQKKVGSTNTYTEAEHLLLSEASVFRQTLDSDPTTFEACLVQSVSEPDQDLAVCRYRWRCFGISFGIRHC